MPWVTLSLLDRLLSVPEDKGRVRAASLEDLKVSLRRDLNYLLNTPKPAHSEVEGRLVLPGTLLNFGISEFVGIDIADPGAQTRIAVAIEQAIRAFEPRLTDVSVTPVLEENVPDRSRGNPATPLQLTFRVRAEFHYHPARERIHFQAVLEGGTGRFEPGEILSDA
jgi:type VI secretion system protein ImpF